MNEKYKYAWEGLSYKYRVKKLWTGGTCNARYCYSVWMRHLIHYYKIKKKVPQIVGEFGPGDTIGMGIMALLCGADKYYAFDFTRFSGMSKVCHILEQLIVLLKNKTRIPDDNEFPCVEPKLTDYDFPTYIFDEEKMCDLLSQERLDKIRESVLQLKEGKNSEQIIYMAPWWDKSIEKCSCDLVFSQAVFEHIDNWREAHAMIKKISHPGTVILHEIDFSCHECSELWNGHWKYGRFLWRMVYGTRPYFLNRIPLQMHINEMKKNGITILSCSRTKNTHGIKREELCSDLKKMNEKDFYTQNAYLIGII